MFFELNFLFSLFRVVIFFVGFSLHVALFDLCVLFHATMFPFFSLCCSLLLGKNFDPIQSKEIDSTLFPLFRSLQDAHHSIIDDCEIIVDYNRQQLMPGWIPRRLGELSSHLLRKFSPFLLQCLTSFSPAGGGLGGKKESGQLRFGGRERPFRAPLYGSSSSLPISI